MPPADLGLDAIRPAVLTIDLHRGHLDPVSATLPLTADASQRVVDANVSFLQQARAADIPVVHVVTSYRDTEEASGNPFWRAIADTEATRANVLRHQLPGSPGLELMPGVFAPRDRVVDTKKRYDCFVGTDLDFLLRAHGVNTLIVTGVNTNSCVLATTAAANVRDYAVIVVEDCVDSMDGAALHEAGLACIRTAFGFVMDTDAVLRLDALKPAASAAA